MHPPHRKLLPCLAALLPCSASAFDGWTPIGPERGHVIDIAVESDRVLAVSRPGVLSADLDLEQWNRTPLFPRNVQRIDVTGSGLWASTPRRVYEIGEEIREHTAFGPNQMIVATESTESGALLVLVRGEQGGVYRLPQSAAGEPIVEGTQVLDEVDPWCVLTHGSEVWVGGLERGLFYSEDEGRSFRLAEASLQPAAGSGGISGIALIGEEIWVAHAEGRVLRAPGGSTVAQAPGPVIAMAPVGDEVFLVVDGTMGPGATLSVWTGSGELEERTVSPVADPDPRSRNAIRPTGLWDLPGERALLGTFVHGPFLIDEAGIRPARKGFQATLTGDVLSAPDGHMILALMSTGIFQSMDGVQHWEPLQSISAPASDTMSLAAVGDSVYMLDFNGISILKEGQFQRQEGVPLLSRRNGLVDLAEGEEGVLWGVDFQQGLWQQDGTGWRQCVTTGALRLDGRRESLLLATARGFLRLGDCNGEATPAWPALANSSGVTARASGDWMAAPEGIYYRGEQVSELSGLAIRAMASQGNKALVVDDQGAVRSCDTQGCSRVRPELPGQVQAIGWLDDGRIWAAESSGSLLVSGGETPLPPFFSPVAIDGSSPAGAAPPEGEAEIPPQTGVHALSGPANLSLRVPPWRSVGRPTFETHAGMTTPGLPPSSPAVEQVSSKRWILAVLAVLLGILTLSLAPRIGKGRKKSRRRRRRRR